ncbi:histidinol-phosphatase HisJ [Alkalihalobacillus sp. AL-G]|uniref:histidinol-phosphatase HisJ n=1 Tax=Alkalihalobacillus sp. AL-G TaxID=2926399 RepID=UPI00272B43E1|nr:histidinol-phosphatase HisJ [Alkalihalobacillus sp. AL-G]WLD92387.1 histidinol-phosphatase HisJ [Alkalihalobacillus sp. AL-G]
MVLFDGHVHTPYCPHGTKDALHRYVEKAIQLGFKGLTFTEHAPLPESFVDPTPNQDSGMNLGQLEEYLIDIRNLKKQYENEFMIFAGLEIDYIEGFEEESINFLDQYGKELDDSILSVHFLKAQDGYHCLDYSPEAFEQLLRVHGNVESVYELYYQTLQKSILVDLGAYKPKRIGHITLVMKFRKRFPNPNINKMAIQSILRSIAEHEMQLDYNGSGVAKPLCGEPYPPDWVIDESLHYKIPLVYGSDAHQAKEMGRGLNRLKKNAPLVRPV